jgi:hypothetical protein
MRKALSSAKRNITKQVLLDLLNPFTLNALNTEQRRLPSKRRGLSRIVAPLDDDLPIHKRLHPPLLQ